MSEPKSCNALIQRMADGGEMRCSLPAGHPGTWHEWRSPDVWVYDSKAVAALRAQLREAKEALKLAQSAFEGLRYKDEPDRFCDHAAAPCHRCDAVDAALAACSRVLTDTEGA